MKKIIKDLLFLFCILLSVLFSSNSLQASSNISQPVMAKHGMVVSEQYLASQVGVDILLAGGNAVDAAVAVGYALAVVEPCCGNLGGGGFMTLRFANGKIAFLNFRERAPLTATPNMYLDKNGNLIPNKSTQGYLAVATPGTVLGLETALKKYGTMTRAQVMAPAIKLAEQGFVLTSGDVQLLERDTEVFKTQPNVAVIFLKYNQPYQAGDRLVQTDLANTLKQISLLGPDVFYKGLIANKIVDASKIQGGILSLQDFAKYKVEELTPIHCSYHNYTITSAPPPSSGGVTICEILNILEPYPLDRLGYHSAQSTHDIVEAMRNAFVDRDSKLGDPDFVNNPTQELTSKSYARQLRQKIPVSTAGSSTHEGNNTTHYSVVDKNGNAVAVTVTLNSFFGAKVIAGNTGFFLNDEMDDFATKPGSANQFGLVQGEANNIQPGKRPLSSMAPTIITKNNQLYMVLGAAGGPRIITGILQTFLNVSDYGMNIQDAVNAPRFHHQWLPDIIFAEPNTFSVATTKELTSMGYKLKIEPAKNIVEAILVDPVAKILYGGSDPRRLSGKAEGY